MDLKFTLTLTASLGALLFSFLNFRRNRKFENENYLYKSKVETYSKIQEELINLTSSLKENYIEAEESYNNPTLKGEKLLNEKAEKVNLIANDFNNCILKNSLFIPDNVFNSLVDFCLKVLNTEPLDSYLENSSIVLLEFKEKFNSIIDEADNISNLLRNDLHIEKLNVSLYRRLN